jgi:hypothetical protein
LSLDGGEMLETLVKRFRRMARTGKDVHVLELAKLTGEHVDDRVPAMPLTPVNFILERPESPATPPETKPKEFEAVGPDL